MSALADPFDARRAARAPGCCASSTRSGVLSAADVHVARAPRGARRRGTRAGRARGCAGRPRRRGSATCSSTSPPSATPQQSRRTSRSIFGVAWPGSMSGSRELAASQLVAVGEEERRPSGRCGWSARRLYLDRYWREERAVAATAREPRTPNEIDARALAAGLQAVRRRPDAPAARRRRAVRRASPCWPAGRAPGRRRPSRGSSRC